MQGLKHNGQSWLFAGVTACVVSAGCFFCFISLFTGLAGGGLGLSGTVCAATLFIAPSTFLNWLYDVRDYAKTQRVWMKDPRGFIGKVGYILTGSIALWGLLFTGMFMAAFLIGGLVSLGQAAWSS